MRGWGALALIALLAGCISPATTLDPASVADPFPADAKFPVTDKWGAPLQKGPFKLLPVEVVDVPSFDGAKMNMGVWRPDVPEGTRVPVLVDFAPYYGELDRPVDQPAFRLGGYLIENFVPHGYAVVQASLRGTGGSEGCFDFMGETEKKDIDAMLTWMGEAEWSNGNIAVLGRSYSGATAWEAAATGNPHVKTIIPLGGVSDLNALHYRNGSAEPRASFMWATYYAYTVPAPMDAIEPSTFTSRACAATTGALHAQKALEATRTGAPMDDPYWQARAARDLVLENYKGSVWYIQGTRDWNVKPDQGTEIYNAFQGKKKAWIHASGHVYPDRPSEHESLRWDWAETLLRWFDTELKGIPRDTGPAMEVEDLHGNWRVEPANAWPVLDATPMLLYPSGDGTLVASGAKGSARILGAMPAAFPERMTQAGLARAVFESAPFEKETRISGLPTLHVTVTPTTPGGNVWAILYEVEDDGRRREVGHAQMDLRYAEGGKTPKAVEAGKPLLAKMEFFPLDARILVGSTLRLEIWGDAGAVAMNPMTAPMEIQLGDDKTVLSLPIIERPFVKSRWDVDL